MNKTKLNLERLTNTFYLFFAVTWGLVIFSEYLRYNPNYLKAIQFFQYKDLFLLLLITGGLLSWGLSKTKKRTFKWFNGLSVFAGMLLLDAITMNLFYSKLRTINLDALGLFSHLAHFVSVAFCTFLIYLVVSTFGAFLTSIFPPKIRQKDLPLIQTVLGIMALTFLLFILGIFACLHVYIVAPLLGIILLLDYRQTLQIVNKILLKPLKIPKEINALGVFSFLFLMAFVVFAFVQILRPFPLGTDSVRIYVNLPALIADYNGLVDGFQPYNWSLFMALGTVVFGRIDVVLALSFLGGLLALNALYRLSRKWLDVNYAALCLFLFYSVPLINHFSYMDMKIDMGLLFISLSVLLVFYNWLSPIQSKEETQKNNQKSIIPTFIKKTKSFFAHQTPAILKQHRLLVLMGLMLGFAMGIKLTSLILFFALVAGIWFVEDGIRGYLIAFFLTFGVVFLFQLDAQAFLRQFHYGVSILQWILLAVGLFLLGHQFLKRREISIRLIHYSLILSLFFLLPVVPWLTKNYFETKKITIEGLLNGKEATPYPTLGSLDQKASGQNVVIPGLYKIPDLPVQNENKAPNVKKGVREDLHKLMGYEILLTRYLSLPFDVFMKSNFNSALADVGICLLLIFPFLFLFSSNKTNNPKRNLANLIFVFFSIAMLFISIPSAFLNQHKLSDPSEGLALLKTLDLSSWNELILSSTLHIYTPVFNGFSSISGQGDSVTYPILLLLFIVLIYLFHQRIAEQPKTTKVVIMLLLIYAFLWWVLGAGASWYGLLLFCLPYVFVLKGLAKPNLNIRDVSFWWSKNGFINIICIIWMGMAFTYRTANFNPVDAENAKQIYIAPLTNYQTGQLDESATMDVLFPNVREIVNLINQDDKALVYRVATQSHYFIHRNDSRVLNDTFLDFFDQLVQSYQNKEKIIQALKDRGFKYIVLDLNMPGSDFTPEKSLTRKFLQLINTLYNNPHVELLMTNRTIKHKETGTVYNAVFEDLGKIVNYGNIALFKIK